MDLLLKKHMWVIHLLVVAACSVFAGKAAAHLIVGSYLADGPPPPPHRPVRPEPPAHGKDPSAILRRNVFCSGCPSPDTVAAEEREKEEAAEGPQKSTLQVALRSILYSDTSSLAVIRDLSSKNNLVWFFHPGDPLFETGATIAQITERRVYLRNGKRLEYLDLDEQPKDSGSPIPPPRVAMGNPADSLAADLDRGLHCNGSSCQADRALVEHLLQNPMQLATAARFVPSIVNGKPNGFKLYAIQPNSLFGRIGLQNGDTIKEINGNSMSSPDRALELYTKLRNASHLTVVVDRRGSTVTMDYTIR